MSYIDTCTIVIYFYIGGTGVFADGMHYLEPQKTFLALPYGHVQLYATSLLDGDGGITATVDYHGVSC